MSAPSLAPSIRSASPAAVVVVAWFAGALAAGALGVFRTGPGGLPVALGIAAALPPLAALTLAAGSPWFRAWVGHLDLRFLTLLQTGRTVGLAFLALAAVDALPAGFAVPAGMGDVAIALTAPFVAAFVVGRSTRWYLAWTALGVADLVSALTLGVLYSSTPARVLHGAVSTDLVASLPLSLVPTFGVPLALVAHILAVVNIRYPR